MNSGNPAFVFEVKFLSNSVTANKLAYIKYWRMGNVISVT